MANTRREREKRERRKSDAQSWAKQQSRGFDSTCIKLPEGVDFYKLEVGTHLIDFMPYVAGKNNPRCDEGMEHFERTYEAHRVPTADGTQLYACRLKCFGKSCYVCNWMRDHARTADPDLIKALRLTTRHLWLVNDKPGDKKNALKVLDTNHYNKGMGFGEMMADAILAVPDYGSFADLQGGMTLRLTVKEDTFPGGKYNKVTRIDFLPRKYDYPDELLDNAPCLDDCVVLVSNEDLRKALGQEPTDEDNDDDEQVRSPASSRSSGWNKPSAKDEEENEDEDTPPSRNGKQARDEETAEDLGLEAGDEVTYKGMDCIIKKISGDGTSLLLEDEDGDEYKAVSPSEVKKAPKAKGKGKAARDEDEDEDDEEPPAKAKGRKAAKDEDEDEELEDEDEDEDEELDEDEDDEDEAPPAKGKAGKR